MEQVSTEAVEPPANVLLLHDRHTEPSGCRELCSGGRPRAELRISFASEDPESPKPGPEGVSKLGLLSVGDVLRAAKADGGPDFSGPVAVDAVADPTDLSAIGVSISRFCEHWHTEDEQLVVCFSSLDSLLRHTDPETIFEFTYYLNKRLASVDAIAHFHLDPTKHADRIVAAFGDIFDAVVVDDSAQHSMPEATDDEIADLIGDLDAADDSDYPWQEGGFQEASDQDIERILGE